ncbi:MAG: hypothetical protein DBX61_11075 [Clostridiales bacterium]|nr:MAG: hypothetical protein DBX61_11075 [Clostridiales bacterium]
MGNRIELRIVKKKPLKAERRCIQISGEANSVLMEIYRATGLPASYIVSQMIIQGSKLVDIVEVDAESAGDWDACE